HRGDPSGAAGELGDEPALLPGGDDGGRRAAHDPAVLRRPGHRARRLRAAGRAADPGRRGHGPVDLRRGHAPRGGPVGPVARHGGAGARSLGDRRRDAGAGALPRRAGDQRGAGRHALPGHPGAGGRRALPRLLPDQGLRSHAPGAPGGADPGLAPAGDARPRGHGRLGAREQHAPPVREDARRGPAGLRRGARRRRRGGRGDGTCVRARRAVAPGGVRCRGAEHAAAVRGVREGGGGVWGAV
ncbi:MAG: hypothetical protein AVDCRST_MAG40-619, partial [uncultured Gemmatimonadaceae bacterium]